MKQMYPSIAEHSAGLLPAIKSKHKTAVYTHQHCTLPLRSNVLPDKRFLTVV
jgi:hypothetical protein